MWINIYAVNIAFKYMTRRAVRQKDVKIAVEEGMNRLGYEVLSQNTNDLGPKECMVRYSDVIHELETNMSYWDGMELLILYNEADNNELPYNIVEILDNVTRYVEDSQYDNSTSFRFTRVELIWNGESTKVEIYGQFDFEIDWVDIPHV
jgi:hypothetical protein